MMKRLFIGCVRLYQLAISPLMANHCRFYPTCSRYAIVAIERHGVVRGSWLAMKRISRCRPGCEGGVDLVPTVGELKQGCSCHKS
ncbi:Putative membrane protein insertion efficiency factor [Ephemeroptericola cinctiostellae]|uniref:Putative membrane protein insertion efficiency factor n=1 Tax=Ephemeroptericola cinctiostellae TaxID=2268024 RepID=A0A345D8L9_9BURK|nr:Putative membrane protein insertion efficiency factor [Ephemeroptericola cinctiostellae]